MANVTNQSSYNGTIDDDTISGTSGVDTLSGGAGNDTLSGGAGDDIIDGGSGFNRYVVTGTADGYIWSINSSGDLKLTDDITDQTNLLDGTNEGTDTLKNIQEIEYRLPNGTTESVVALDDYSNSVDASNIKIKYGEWTSGRINYYADTDYFKLDTMAGQKVELQFGSTSGYGYLSDSRNGNYIGNGYAYGSSGDVRNIAFTETATQDINFRSESLNENSPMSSSAYSFIFRRTLEGTDSAETLNAGESYEKLAGGAGDDTLTGSSRSDKLDGGTGNDIMTGGAGNDEIDGGEGAANIAIFSGNRSDYSISAGSYDFTIRDNTSNRDGIDTLKNVQIFRFADGDVVIDKESNTPVTTGSIAVGQNIVGSIPIIKNYYDSDYFQQKFSSDISSNTTLRLTVTTSSNSTNFYGYANLYFYAQGSSDLLTFKNIGQGGNSNIDAFDFSLSGSSSKSWIISPSYWGSSNEFTAMVQKADVKIGGYASESNNVPSEFGSLVNYTIKIDRVLYGTSATDDIKGDGVAGYIDAQAGNDIVTGSSIDEQIIGGAGDDTLKGGDGNDTLEDSSGKNILNGDAGDDTIDISGSTTPNATVDGGAGDDTLKIGSNTNWTNLTVSGVEILDGSNGEITLSPDQIVSKGFTTAKNITFKLDQNLSSGGTLDGSVLSGALNLRGTNQSDILIGNESSNTIYLNSATTVGSGLASDNVSAGGGDDTIVIGTISSTQWSNFFTRVDQDTKTYYIDGSIDGGNGTDKLTLDFSNSCWYHPWGDTWNEVDSPSWKLDLSNLNISSIEKLEVAGYDSLRFWAYPSEFILTAEQLNSLSNTSGLKAVSIVGGGTIDLAKLSSLGIDVWRIGDDKDYLLNGTTLGDTITVGSGKITVNMGDGNDDIVIDSKALVSDTINGGNGTDTLNIRGADVDLSNAIFSGIESIKVSSKSLSMTDAQWRELGSIVSRVSGADTGYILSVTTPGVTTLDADSQYVGLTGSSEDDTLIGNSANNILVGGSGNDILTGNGGDDRLVTGEGIDKLSGGDGNDTLVITNKTSVRDTLDGGLGIDTLEVSNGQDLTTSLISNIEILKGSGTATLAKEQLESFAEIQGVAVQLSGDDTSFSLGNTKLGVGSSLLLPSADLLVSIASGAVIGSKNDDTINGGTANDVLIGGRGGDTLSGGSGNDTLIGGSGIDTLSGGSGNDTFLVESTEFNTPDQRKQLIGNLYGYHTVYGDKIDGGEGSDKLTIDFQSDTSSWNKAYVINEGAVSNIETLSINLSSNSGSPSIVMDSSTFKQFDKIETIGDVGSSKYYFLSLGINGKNEDINFDTISSDAKIGRVELAGNFKNVDTSHITVGPDSQNTDVDYNSIQISNFDSIKLSAGNDGVVITSDKSFSLDAGAGDDIIKLNSIYGALDSTIDGGAGVDKLDLSSSWFIDLTKSKITNIESIQYGTSTILVTQTQLDNLSFDGSGAKFTKIGNDIIGTTAADNYTGEGIESFQGGKENDTISNVDTAVFTGNLADYDYDLSRTNGNLVIQHARGTLADGTDTLNGVMNLKFADTTLKIDDAPNDNYRSSYINNSTNWDRLPSAEYGKKVSAKHEYGSDTDLFSAVLAPNSPLTIEKSASKDAQIYFYFYDAVTGSNLSFKSLVNGQENYAYSPWMSSDDKWLPMLNGKPYEGGNVIIKPELNSNTIQDYTFTINYLDDYAGSVDTLGEMNANTGMIKGYIGDEKDADWIRTDLIAGTKYEFHLQGVSSGGGTLVDPKLVLRDSEGRVIASDPNMDILVNKEGFDDTVIFRPTESGSYYLSVADVADINKGSWTLTQKSLDVIAGDVSTTERIILSGANTFTVSSEINELSDHDWFKIWLDKGMTYNLQALGTSGGGTLGDPQLSIRSATGILLAQDDNGGNGTDSKLAYSAPDSGWYYLDIGASGNASKGTYVLKGSTLADDYSNDIFTQGVAQIDTPFHGLISYINDSDWIKVGLSKGVTYLIDLSGDISDSAELDPLNDTLLLIRNSNGEIIGRYDDFGGTLNARAYFTPTENGLYYLEAKSAFKYDIGAYQLSVMQAPADDYGSLMDSSATTLGIGLSNIKSGEIGMPGDHDVFKITLEEGKVYQISLDGLSAHGGTLSDSYLRIFDSTGHIVDFDNNGGVGNDSQMYFAPTTTGIYYIEASSNNDKNMGTYKIGVTQHDIPADDVPNNVSSKVLINPGDSFSGALLTHNDQDWIGIRLLAEQDYVFKLKASHSGNGTLVDPLLEVHAADGTLLKSVDNMLFGNEPSLLFTPTADGTYYLVAKAHDGQTDTGTYTLITRAPDDYSNSKADATNINLDQTLDGAIQWSDGSYGVRAYDSIGLANDFDEDWFKFTAVKDQILSIQAEIADGSALSRPMIEVVDKDGRSLAIGDGLETNNGNAIATFKASSDGTYYARVIDGAGATGGYKISLVNGDSSDEDASGAISLDFTTNGAIVQAQATAKIGLSGDIDNFIVQLQEGHNYRIETLAVRDGSYAPLSSAQLKLNWTANGATESNEVSVLSDVGSPTFFQSTTYNALTSGTMDIKLSPIDSTQTGKYKIRIIDLGTTTSDDRPDFVSEYGNSSLLAINENIEGKIDSLDDVDLYSIDLTAGNIYNFSIKSYADGLGTLSQGILRLLDSEGHLVTVGTYDSTSGRTELPVSVFENGKYYLSVSASEIVGNTGTYTLDTRLQGADDRIDDINSDTQSGVYASPGHVASGTINYDLDHDWIKVSLVAGKVYVLDVLADGDGAGGTLKDSSMRLLDSEGNELSFDDNSGAGLDSHIQYTALETADYYIDVSSGDGGTGTYSVRVRELYNGVADPLKSTQWYLDASGIDKLNGQITGAGVTVGVVDEGIDTSHPDLINQLNFALAYDSQFDTKDGSPKYPKLIGPPDNHGTLVAGIIAAEANNQTGIVGVAPDAELVSTRVKWTWDQITEALGRQSQFDISNNSWGAINIFSDNFNSTDLTFAWQALRDGVENGRDGLGTVFVFSAGNSASSGDNTNYHNFQNAREVIAVGAAQENGEMAGFSTPGANVLVSSYGVNMITTDRHQPGLGANPASNYSDFSGTSAAAPMISGIVALMLEANPNLGYRDVQEILVYASTHPDNQDWKVNGATNFNLGGLEFNDKAGFGIVDAYSAVKLAETWTDVSSTINEVSASARKFGLTDAIPDGNDTIYTRKFTIDSAINVEHVELGVDLRHTRLGDLVIELTSPNGTVSTLMNQPTVNSEQPFGLSGTDSGVPTHLLWDFSSVQFWGEEATGEWTVTIKDLRAEETGTIKSLSLRVYGERDDGNDTYVFTEEAFNGVQGKVLSDETGTDIINASPMLHDMYVDLSEKLIASNGVEHTIASWTTIENVVTGLGDDRVVGDDVSNTINTGAGNDTLEGGKGDDILNGGIGQDTLVYQGKMAEYTKSWNPTTKQLTIVDNVTTDLNEGTDIVTNIERIVFSDGEMSLSKTVGNHAPIANSSFFDNPIIVKKGMGIDYDIPESAFVDTDTNSASTLEVKVSMAAGGELPEWLIYNSETKKFEGVPPADMQGQIKLLVTAVDEFGETASDILTLQFGDNQAPTLDNPQEKTIDEDAGNVFLGIIKPIDPEGKEVNIKILEIPTKGIVVDKNGNKVEVGSTMSADAISELHYNILDDLNGDAGYIKYQAIDEDNVTSESSIHIFVNSINDAPRFDTVGSKLIINYPAQETVTLDINHPYDVESVITSAKIIALPSLGSVSLDGENVLINQILTFDQLDRLNFTLKENVNGPIGGVTIQAVDPEGLATNWTLELEINGDASSSRGTKGDDSLYGSIGIDTLYGMGGNDILTGNAGNDKLYGGLGNDKLYGGSGNDILDGSSGNDILDGGLDNDIMSGGPGNDTYYVDSSSDTVLEVISKGAGGMDLIASSISLVAPTNIENLQASSGVVINLTGNELDNVLLGNELANILDGKSGRDTIFGGLGNDTLDGGVGVDRLIGSAGDDIYYVDSRNDKIIELINEGHDVVNASCSYTLSSNIENLILEGTGDFSAGGNSLNNYLMGNAGNNILAGGLGTDTLEGGFGNDTYVLSDKLDTILDTGGIDTIRSILDIDYLQSDIENGELVGINDTSITGNNLDNVLTGNIGNNILDGGLGIDVLTGGEGDDQFIISYNGSQVNIDTITDFKSGSDLLIFDMASFGIDTSHLGAISSGLVSNDSFVKGTGAEALDNNDYFIFDTARDVLKFDSDGNGSASAVDFVKLTEINNSFAPTDIYIVI